MIPNFAELAMQMWREHPLEEQLKGDTLTNQYSITERKKLYEIMLVEIHKNLEGISTVDVDLDNTWGYSMPVSTFVQEFEDRCYPLIAYYFKDAFKLLTDKIEDMPLYINSDDWRIRTVAKWRLALGR